MKIRINTLSGACLHRTLIAIGLTLIVGHPARALVPVSGVAVPELAHVDVEVQAVMANHPNLTAATVAIMHHGSVVYERGFGWMDAAQTIPLPEDALMRVASVTKPIIAAAVRKLIADPTVPINLDTKVFDDGSSGAGILAIDPWFPTSLPPAGACIHYEAPDGSWCMYSPNSPAATCGFGNTWNCADPELTNITIEHLLGHTGGWDTALVCDPMFKVACIAEQMGVCSPPERDDIVRFMLGQPLQHTPGTVEAYSNFGYMLLGLIIEQETGMTCAEYVHQEVLRPLGVSPNDLQHGRTLPEDRDPREPVYNDHQASLGFNVFWNGDQSCSSDPCDFVPRPDGAWHHESMVGHGDFISTSAALLPFLDKYKVWGYGIDPDIGEIGCFYGDLAHKGSLLGTLALAFQNCTGEDVLIAIILNYRTGNDNTNKAILNDIRTAVTSTSSWPSFRVTDVWVDFLQVQGGDGTYVDPYGTYHDALNVVAPGGKIKFLSGSIDMQGTFNEPITFMAPFNDVTFGI